MRAGTDGEHLPVPIIGFNPESRPSTVYLDGDMVDRTLKRRDQNAYPDQCPPENGVKLLTHGMDEKGHKLCLPVDGRLK